MMMTVAAALMVVVIVVAIETCEQDSRDMSVSPIDPSLPCPGCLDRDAGTQ